MQNAAILTGTGLALRAAGLLLRVLLANVLGEGGMGLYSLTFTVYNLFITLAQSGIGVAVTRLVAQYLALKEHEKAAGALRACLIRAGLLGGLSGGALFLGAPFLARYWIGDLSCAFALRILAFSLPFMAIAGCFNGYFLGRREVRPGCIAQTLEQAVRLGMVGLAVGAFRSSDRGFLLGMVVLANTVSEGISCLFLAVQASRKKEGATIDAIPKGAVGRIALPVAASKYLSTALHSTENILIPTAIARHTGDYSLGLAQFGALKGMAIPLLFFPASFLNALSSLLVPEVTETYARGERKATGRIVGRALEITAALSVMIGGIFFLYGKELGRLLYHSETVGMMLQVLAPITPFMYLDTIADGLLKGMDQQRYALRNNTIDSILRILLTAVAVPAFGIKGFLGVMVFSNILVATLNLRTLLRACCLGVDWSGLLLRPLAAVGIATALWALFPLKSGLMGCILGAGLWGGCYLLLYRLTLPKKESIIGVVKKRKEVRG